MTENIEMLLHDLKYGNDAQRTDAAKRLVLLNYSSKDIVRALEHSTLTDSNETVQHWSLVALAVPIHHKIQRQLIYTNTESRQIMLSHIEQWASEGLITGQTVAILKGRYALQTNAPLPQKPKAEPPKATAVPSIKSHVVPIPLSTLPSVVAKEVEIPQAEISQVEIPQVEIPQVVAPPVLPEPALSFAEPQAVMAPKVVVPEVPFSKKPVPERVLYDGEIASQDQYVEVEVEQPLLEKQKFSLVATLTSEVTIKIALYLGAFLILAAAVIFASLVAPARFPMLTITILGFLTAANVTTKRLPQGSFVLFMIGTLLIPIDAVIFIALINAEASLLYWALVGAGMSIIWTRGTYLYESRFLSLMVFATFSLAVYLVAASSLSIMSAEFLFIVSLVAGVGLGEAVALRRWKGDRFFEPMFGIAQLQSAGVLCILVINLLLQLSNLFMRIVGEGQLSTFDSQETARFGAWLTLGVFYFASDHLTWHMKKWQIPAFRVLVTVCLMIPPIFIMEAMSADPLQIAGILWGWGALLVVGSEILYPKPDRWLQTYSFLFLGVSFLFLASAPLVAYVTTPTYAVGYLIATSLAYFTLAYRRSQPIMWSIALIAAYLAYLVGIDVLDTGSSPVFKGFALIVPALVFLSVELVGRRYFRASEAWTEPPLFLGLITTIWDVGILISWYSKYPTNAAIIFLIYGVFGVIYARRDNQPERGQSFVAWTAGLLAIYATYINVVPNVNQIDFGGYLLLAPALAFLSAELVGKRYFQAGQSWTISLLGLGLFNAGLGIFVTLLGGLASHAESAAIIFLIYGVFGVVYAAVNARSEERDQTLTAWIAGLIALYVSYGFLYRLPAIEDLNIFPGYALLIPALVFLSAELIGKLRFHMSRDWTEPFFWLGLLNVGLAVMVTLIGGWDDAPGSATIIFVILGLFAVLYAALTAPSERENAVVAWTAGMILLYVAYGYIYRTPDIQRLDIFPGYALLIPTLIFFSGELAGKLYFRASRDWTLSLFGLGLVNAVMVVPLTLNDGLNNAPNSAAIVFLILGLFGVAYAALTAPTERAYAIIAWTVGLIALYFAYGFVFRLPAIERLDIFAGFAFLIATLIFLSGELAGKLYFRASRDWTLPLFGLGLLNAALVVPVALMGGFGDAPGSAVIIFLIYGLFSVLYSALTVPSERFYALIAWAGGMIALYAAYGFIYRLPAIEDLNIFPGYALLIPTLVFLSGELAGKLYFRASRDWTLPLFGLGLFNAALVIPVALQGGFGDTPDSAVIIFFIFGLFSVVYTALNAPAERAYAIIAWTVGMIALYVAYGFVFRLPAIEDLNIFPGYALLVAALVFLSGEIAGKRYFHAGKEWTLPLFGLGVLNAALVVPVTLQGGLGDYPGNAVIILLIYGLFGMWYARMTVQSTRDYAIIAWTISLIALDAAYGFIYLLQEVKDLGIFAGYAFLIPTLAFLLADLVAKARFHAGKEWTLPLFSLGVLNAAVVIPFTIQGGLGDYPGHAIIILSIYGLFGMGYARMTVQSTRDYALAAWVVSLIALDAAYGFIYRLPEVKDLGIFAGYAFLIPTLAFLTADLVAKARFHMGKEWTLPLFSLGVLNAIVVVPFTIQGGLEDYPGSAVIIFVVYGLFGMLYARMTVQSTREYALVTWAVGLVALYIAYGFVYRLPSIERLDIFLGYALLIPALVYLSAELVGKLYFQMGKEWTLPLFWLGLFNAALVVPVALDGGWNNGAAGSAAIIFLVYGLFAAFYIMVNNASAELGYLATSSLMVSVVFAILFYNQDHWVLPFIGLAAVYYLGGLAIDYYYQRRDWSQVFYLSGVTLGTVVALSAPFQGGGDGVLGMGVVATVYGAEAFRRRNIWFGMPANALFLGAYIMALRELNVSEPQFYSIGTALMAIVTHYLLYRRNEEQADWGVAFVTGVIAQLILLGTSFAQMGDGLQFFFILFFQSLILLGYGLVIRSLSFTIVPILFVVVGVLRVIFVALAGLQTVVILGCTGLSLVLLGITALFMRERLLETYEELQRAEEEGGTGVAHQVLDRVRSAIGLGEEMEGNNEITGDLPHPEEE